MLRQAKRSEAIGPPRIGGGRPAIRPAQRASWGPTGGMAGAMTGEPRAGARASECPPQFVCKGWRKIIPSWEHI